MEMILRFGDLRPKRPIGSQIITAVWPAVLHTITACNIRNYTIFLHDGCLFGYFEYVGRITRQTCAGWPRIQPHSSGGPSWSPAGTPADRADGEWWASMEEVFHHGLMSRTPSLSVTRNI